MIWHGCWISSDEAVNRASQVESLEARCNAPLGADFEVGEHIGELGCIQPEDCASVKIGADPEWAEVLQAWKIQEHCVKHELSG